MSRVRVALVDLSPLLTSMITELIGGPEIEVVTGRPGADLSTLVADTGAAVVIMPGEGNDLSDAGRRFLDDRARVRVLAVNDHARTGVLGDLAVRTVTLEDLSKATLLDAVIGEAGGPDWSATSPLPRAAGDLP